MATDPETQAFLNGAPASREAQYQQLFADLDAAERAGGYDERTPEPDEDPDTAIDQSILSVDKARTFDVTISTGGPAEWLECTVDADGELTQVKFAAAWWSPVQYSTVNEGDALWRLAERVNPWEGSTLI